MGVHSLCGYFHLGGTDSVFVCILQPHDGTTQWESQIGFWSPTSRDDVLTQTKGKSSPIGINNLNVLWADLLNSRAKAGYTHVAMMHADIVANPGWLDILLDEMDASGADVVSAVVPIKDDRGVTSTAIDTGDPWHTRRYTMAEVMEMPKTIVRDDLVLNTGLWVAKVGDWMEKVWFEFKTRIIRLHDGSFLPEQLSEDWDFSVKMREQGLRLAATRAVPLYHQRPEYTNTKAWGRYKTDEDFTKYMSAIGAR